MRLPTEFCCLLFPILLPLALLCDGLKRIWRFFNSSRLFICQAVILDGFSINFILFIDAVVHSIDFEI